MVIPYLIIIFVSFGGFILSVYIRHKKVSKETLVCPLKSNCETVIFSGYSKFFGMPVELIGIAYYLIVGIAYGVFLGFGGDMPQFLVFGVFSMTIAAFLFSLYLTFIQAFALKQWCTWCLVSAGLSTTIFSLVIFASPYSLVELFETYHGLILGLHVLAIAIGLGGATITDVFFFRFLKDLKISEFESDILNTLSQVIWFALAVIVITGVGLFLPESEHLLASSKFLVKMIIVSVILVNGLVLNLLISPKLIHISFGAPHQHQPGELIRLRKLSFALGAISLISWYSAFILGAIVHNLLPPFWPLLGIYAGLILIGIIGSQIVERNFAKRTS